jgi:hypothetical protein
VDYRFRFAKYADRRENWADLMNGVGMVARGDEENPCRAQR